MRLENLFLTVVTDDEVRAAQVVRALAPAATVQPCPGDPRDKTPDVAWRESPHCVTWRDVPEATGYRVQLACRSPARVSDHG